MQQATTVVSKGEQLVASVIRGREILSLQIVQNWLACLNNPSKDTISSDSKMGGLSCLIELSQ